MSRKAKLSLVSSTPHVKKIPNLATLFDNETISPINPEIKQVKPALKRPKSSLSKPAEAAKENAAVAKKRKCIPPKKEKESASSAALREMGVKMRATSTNFLSISRQNMFNMFPQPILLDSDEDADNPIKNEPGKKNAVNNKPKPLAREKNINPNEKLNKNPDSTKNLQEIKSNVKEKSNGASQVQDTPQPSTSRTRVTRKHPLSNLANINSPSGKVRKTRDKQAVIKKNVDPTILIDSKDDINPECTLPLNFSSVRKATNFKFSFLEDIFEDDAIKWTPRSKIQKRTCVGKKTTEGELESSNSEDCNILNTIQENDCTSKRTAKENIAKATKDVPVKNKLVGQDKSSSKDLFSSFADVIFKPSIKHKGCVIAASLVTGANDFGYLELDGDRSFFAKRSHITYVLIEGLVEAWFHGGTKNMSPGDILHIQNDMGYKFLNLQSTHARFLYVKGKQHS